MSEAQPIIKKVKKGKHPHHGGAWKIAYADFVTAMMAFFLLLWLISMTTPEQKQGLADYFAPANVSRSTSGSGGVMGGTAFDIEGSRMAGTTPQVVMNISAPPKPKNSYKDEKDRAESAETVSTVQDKQGQEGATQVFDEQRQLAASTSREKDDFRSAAESIRQALRDMPELAELSKNILVEETPEGLQIQLVDQEGRSMFPAGIDEPYERTRRLLEEVATIVQKLPNRIAISGHTDSSPSYGSSPSQKWELTADRANATRRILQGAGVPDDRIYEVTGKADTQPLFPEDPSLPANRRISILLKREAPVVPPNFGDSRR